MPLIALCIALLAGFTDSDLGYTLEPPSGYVKGSYEDSAGASWTAPDGMTELRILVLPIMPGEDAQKTIEELVNQLMLHELSRAYFTDDQLKLTQAKSGMWVDVEAGAGAKGGSGAEDRGRLLDFAAYQAKIRLLNAVKGK